jgi:peptidoglycan/LPS O-acetylase OafA/YrhL
MRLPWPPRPDAAPATGVVPAGSAGASPGLRYRPELDGLRAFAVLLVLLQHVLQPGRFAGFMGVDVFFVLSGFLITTILLTELDRTGRLRLGRFWFRRVLRLYPALLTLLVVCLPLAPWLSGSLLQHLERTVVAGTYTSNLFMTHTGQWLGPFTHTWSLALEEQFYLAWPLVLLVALRSGAARIPLAMALLTATVGSAALHLKHYEYGTISAPLASTSTGLLAGSVLALVLASGARPWFMRVLRWRAWAIGGILLLASSLVLFSLTDRAPDGLYTLAAILATALVLGHTTSRDGGLLVRVLSLRPAVWLGRVSYGIYLWHYPAVLVLADAFPEWSPWWRLPLVAGFAVVAAALSHRWVEAPFLRLKDRLGALRTADRRSAPAVDVSRAPAEQPVI